MSAKLPTLAPREIAELGFWYLRFADTALAGKPLGMRHLWSIYDPHGDSDHVLELQGIIVRMAVDDLPVAGGVMWFASEDEAMEFAAAIEHETVQHIEAYTEKAERREARKRKNPRGR